MPKGGVCRGHRHSVLIVDEDAAARSFLEMRLLLADFDVTCARHGRAALQLLSLGIYPCVILVDVVKPSVGGSELRRALLYGENFHRISVQALPAVDGRAAMKADVAEVVGGLLVIAERECPYVAVFRRAPLARRSVAEAVRPPRVRKSRTP
jgi:CheY-like chemotaxis protein